MRRFRWRIKSRTSMIVLAAGAALLGVGIATARLTARSASYRARAVDYASREARWEENTQRLIQLVGDSERIDREHAEESRRHSGLEHVLLVSQGAVFRTQAINVRKKIPRSRAKAEWFAMMKARYEFAGSHPWISVPPDPAEPN